MLYVQENHVDLVGFDELRNKAYFSFRNRGLAISGNRMDIFNPQVEYEVKDGQIYDSDLCKILSAYGYDDMHDFTKSSDNIYFSVYPSAPVISHFELLKKLGIE